EIVAWPLAARPEPGDRAPDEIRMPLEQIRDGYSEAVEGAGKKVLDYDIGVGNQRQNDLTIGPVAEVGGKAFLVPVYA
ncbi:MAG TPA: hypothetical protein VNJ04_00085, partial [Gemmatimonadaceae bacterium]|nr:hypothetical protein [Gemmatimonadaceae bacterium]